ncbi:MAG: hypothetical protein Q8M95_06680 [Candidatus Methanoperedens sp.]|nr:hypothetical protein [Candidatus Methanoperedens sp.]
MSLLTDHMLFAPKYRGKMLVGDVAMICGGIICKTWCGDHLWAPSCFHGSVGQGWDIVEKYIREQDVYEYNRGK